MKPRGVIRDVKDGSHAVPGQDLPVSARLLGLLIQVRGKAEKFGTFHLSFAPTRLTRTYALADV